MTVELAEQSILQSSPLEEYKEKQRKINFILNIFSSLKNSEYNLKKFSNKISTKRFIGVNKWTFSHTCKFSN